MSATDTIDRASLETPDKRAPSLGLLIKLLKMTTSNRDGEALAFLRRANLEVEKFGGWEKLLSGKVTVFADPFTNLPDVKTNSARPPTPATAGSYSSKPHAPPPPPPTGSGGGGGSAYYYSKPHTPPPSQPTPRASNVKKKYKTTINLSDL